VLDELDCFGSARDVELVVDRSDVGLDGRGREVEPIGDLLEREMCWKEAEDPQLGRGEPVVLSSPDPRFETPQSVGKRSGFGVSLHRVASDLREFEGADTVAEVEADVGAAQREVGVDPRGRAEVPVGPADALELARSLGVVTALLLRECSCGVGDGAPDSRSSQLRPRRVSDRSALRPGTGTASTSRTRRSTSPNSIPTTSPDRGRNWTLQGRDRRGIGTNYGGTIGKTAMPLTPCRDLGHLGR
jgi:hypothetical protein